MDERAYRAAEARLWASEGVTPTERWVEVDGVGRVRVQEVGDGPPVLFVHGATNSGVSWASLVARLPGFRCLALDRPGCGLSEPVAEPFADAAALGAFADRLAADVLDGLGVAQAALIGTSYGGLFAQRAAAAHPGRFTSLVLLGWTAGAPMARVPPAMRMTAVPGIGRLIVRVPPTRGGVRTILRQVGLRGALESGAFGDEALDAYHALLRHTPTMRNEVAVTRRVFSVRRGLDPDLVLDDDHLHRITCPTLVLWGQDEPFGGVEAARELVDRLPSARVEVVSGGHAVWIDDPDGIGRLLAAFLG